MMRVITILFTAAMAALVGCASQRPVLYPSAHLSQVGTSVAERDIDLCMRRAEDYMASDGRTENALKGAAVGGGTGAAVGAAAGAAGERLSEERGLTRRLGRLEAAPRV